MTVALLLILIPLPLFAASVDDGSPAILSPDVLTGTTTQEVPVPSAPADTSSVRMIGTEWSVEAAVMPAVYLSVTSSDEANTPVTSDTGFAAEFSAHMRRGLLRLGVSASFMFHDIGRHYAYRSADLLAHAGIVIGDGFRFGIGAFYGLCVLAYRGELSPCQSFGVRADISVLLRPVTLGCGINARFSLQEGLASYLTLRHAFFVSLGVML